MSNFREYWEFFLTTRPVEQSFYRIVQYQPKRPKFEQHDWSSLEMNSLRVYTRLALEIVIVGACQAMSTILSKAQVT
jgi:hypothetical protein